MHYKKSIYIEVSITTESRGNFAIRLFLSNFNIKKEKSSKEYYHYHQGWKYDKFVNMAKYIHATLTANKRWAHERKKSCRIANMIWWPMTSIYIKVKKSVYYHSQCIYLDCDYLHVIGYFHIMEFVFDFSKAIDRNYYLLFCSKIYMGNKCTSRWVDTIRRWPKRSLEWKL